jgi:hypothetical protein
MTILPLFPIVSDAVREFFWDDLLQYMDKNVAILVKICKDSETTGDVRGR